MGIKLMRTLLVHFGDIAWVESNNMRKVYGETTAVCNSLADKGWSDIFPVPAVEDGCGKLDDSQRAGITNRLQIEWDRLKDIATAQASEINVAELTVFEALHTKEVDGVKVLRIPHFSGNAGFRRARTYRKSQVQRFMPDKNNAGKQRDIKTMIPINVKYYDSEADRLFDQQEENEIQGVGTKKMEDLEKLSTTKQLFDAGVGQARIRDLYKSTTGQKTYGICLADVNWPTLTIYNRYHLPSDDTRHIPWGATEHTVLTKLNNRHEAARKRKEGLGLTKDERGMEPFPGGIDDLGLADAEAYFAKLAHSGRDNAPKIMSKEDMKTKKTNDPLLVVRSVMDSVLANTTSNLQSLYDNKEMLNQTFTLAKSGNGDTTLDILKPLELDVTTGKFKDELGVTVMKEVALLIAKGKSKELLAAIELIKNPVLTVPPPVETETTKPSGKKEKVKAS